MSEEKKRRLEKLAQYLDMIPEEKQEGIVTGIGMVAAVFEEQKKSA